MGDEPLFRVGTYPPLGAQVSLFRKFVMLGRQGQELTAGWYVGGARRCFSSAHLSLFVSPVCHLSGTVMVRMVDAGEGSVNNFLELSDLLMKQLLSSISQLDHWVTSRTIAHSRLPQVAATIPTLGYMILWSDRFEEYLTSAKLHISFGTWRLQCIWWGALFLVIGLLIYWMRCPRPVKRAGSAEDYLALQFLLPDNYRLSQFKRTVEQFVALHNDKQNDEIVLGNLTKQALVKAATSSLSDETKADLLRFEWEQGNEQRALSRRSAATAMFLGTLLFLTPSADVTFRVACRLVASFWT
jgi:hypothetical protein